MAVSICIIVVQSLSHVRLFATTWTAAHHASLSITNSWSLLKLMLIESVMPSNHLVLCCPFPFCLYSFPASGSFLMSQLFTSGSQSIGASASASVLPMNLTHSHNHRPEKGHASSIPRKIPCAPEVSMFPISSITIYYFHLFCVVWALPCLFHSTN